MAPTAATTIPFKELKLGELLGKGQFGTVQKGVWKGQEVAIKCVLVQEDYDYRLYFGREVDVLNLVRHPFCLKFLGVSTNGNDLYIITEFVKDGTLREYLNRKQPSWTERCRIAIEIASALDYLHRNHIIHRDVKTENVLMTEEGRVKICDFGFSRADSNTDAAKRKTFLGSEWFEAPEIMFCTDYDERIDIFSYGMILCEMLSGKSPSMSVFKRVMPGFGVDADEIRSRAMPGAPGELVSVAIQCCQADPDHRPTLVDAITYLREAYREASGKEYVDNTAKEEVQIEKTTDLMLDMSMTDLTVDGPVRDLPSPSGQTAQAPNVQKLLDEVKKTTDQSAPLTKGALMAMAQLQLTLGDTTDATKGPTIPREGQLQWRAFLMEVRSHIKTRDVQVLGALRRVKTYRSCFSGAEAVDWLVREKQIRREDAAELGKTLVRLNVVRSVTADSKSSSKSRLNSSLFKDSTTALYRFSEDGIFFHDRAPAAPGSK